VKQKYHLILLYLALILSISANFYLYKKHLLLPDKEKEKVSLSPDSILPSERIQKGTLNSVYIMPHPPHFLEGRRLYFREYTINESPGKSKIVFQEKLGNKWQATEVDSEAVRWK